LFPKFTIEQVVRGCQDPSLALDLGFWVHIDPKGWCLRNC